MAEIREMKKQVMEEKAQLENKYGAELAAMLMARERDAGSTQLTNIRSRTRPEDIAAVLQLPDGDDEDLLEV